MLKIPWTEHSNNDEDFAKIETKILINKNETGNVYSRAPNEESGNCQDIVRARGKEESSA